MVYFANTKKQELHEHSFAIGYVARALIAHIFSNSDDTQQLQKAAYIAGCLHDIGKLDPEFQKFINKTKNIDIMEDGVHINAPKKFSFEEYPTHNEISLLILHTMFDSSHFELLHGSDSSVFDIVKHVVFWHHAKPLRNNKIDRIEQIKSLIDANEFTNLHSAGLVLIEQINKLSNDVLLSTFQLPSLILSDKSIKDITVPRFKEYGSIKDIASVGYYTVINSNNNIVRSAVIKADRLISSLSADELRNHIINNTLDAIVDDYFTTSSSLPDAIQTMLTSFDTPANESRNILQSKAASDLSNINGIAVLRGAAGVGKTKLSLEYALNTNVEKIFWISSRTAICKNIYNELKNKYLPTAHIEICTGDTKHTYINGTEVDTLDDDLLTGDIIITTIDQIINFITTHSGVVNLIDFLKYHVIFDEFHELASMPGFNLLFKELIESKQKKRKANTLLMSATPNYVFVNELLEVRSTNVVNIKSFNNKPYNITIQNYTDDFNPFITPVQDNTFVITNTAIMAQKSVMLNPSENSLLAHSKLTASDRDTLFVNLFSSFGQGGTNNYDLVRSGSIMQASLEVSATNVLTEITTIEDIFQRLGRNNRWGIDDLAFFTICVPDRFNKSSSYMFLSSMYQNKSAASCAQFLYENIASGTNYSINELYVLYDAYYANNYNKEEVRKDIIRSIDKGIKLIEDMNYDPVRYVRKPEQTKPTIKKKSLRGCSNHVQMAKYDISNNTFNEYIVTDSTVLTLSTEEILRNDCLHFMMRYHTIMHPEDSEQLPSKHIKGDDNRRRRLLTQSKSSESPIWVSYTSDDLNKIKLDIIPDSFIFYVVDGDSVIGIMEYSKLIEILNMRVI